MGIHCYAGDADRVERLLPYHEKHGVPIVILSSEDQPVVSMGPHICRRAGRSGYIGQHTLDRQLAQLRILLEYPFNWYLLNDSDSFCVSAKIPTRLYQDPTIVWSNEVVEPRPHPSRYPKIAMQAPYFLSRHALEEIVSIGPHIRAHPITPYIDHAMLMWTCEMGLRHEPFARLEAPNGGSCEGMGPQEWLDARVRYYGATMMHPIKTKEELDLVVKAREFYERRR